MSKLLTLQRDVRDVRLACFASFTSCLQLQKGACETLADAGPLCASAVEGRAGQCLLGQTFRALLWAAGSVQCHLRGPHLAVIKEAGSAVEDLQG